MAVTPTVSRSRQNDFFDAKKDENKIKPLIENGAEGDHITLHAGDFSEVNLEVTTPIDIPENVYVTIMNGVEVEEKDPTTEGEPFPLYDIFTGHTENIADLRQVSWKNFSDRAVWAVESAQDLALNDVKMDSLEIDGPGPDQAFSVNKNGNGDVKVGDLDKNRLAYAVDDDGTLRPASDLVYDGNRFDVTAEMKVSQSVEIQQNLTVTNHTQSGTASAQNLDDNSVVVADTRSGRKGTLVDYSQFTFDGTKFQVGTPQNEVQTKLFGRFRLNKNSSNYDFHIKPDDGAVIESWLSVNGSSPTNKRALQVFQNSKDVGFYLETESIKDKVITVDNENREILRLDGYGLMDIRTLRIEDWITTKVGRDLILSPSTNRTEVQSHLLVNQGFTAIGEVEFYDNFPKINAGGSGSPVRNAGILVDRGSEDDVDIRWNETTDEWEFTNDGVTYQSFTDSQFQVGTEIIDVTINSGSSETFDLTTLFAPAANTDQTLIEVYVKDTTPGAPTQGEYINAEGVSTTVRKSQSYEVYNEFSSDLDFRVIIKRF